MPENNTPDKAQTAPTNSNALVGLTKRQQLEKTNKTIFLWVAAASVVLALSIVALQLLVRTGLFNAKIIKEQQVTSRTLDESKDNFDELKRNVDALLADKSLSALRVSENDNSLQVILDALPTTGDATSLSNSLYNKVLQRRSTSVTGVSVGAAGVAAAAPAVADPAAPVTLVSGPQPISFQLGISGSPDQIRDTLLDLEKVIRPMNVKQINLAASGGQLEVGIQGETYFLPRSTIKLGEKTIKP